MKEKKFKVVLGEDICICILCGEMFMGWENETLICAECTDFVQKGGEK